MEEGPDLVALEADVIPVQVDINQFNQSSRTFFTGPSNGRRSGRGALPGSLGGWCNFFFPGPGGYQINQPSKTAYT